MKINGKWKSSSGSILNVKEDNGKLNGTFQLGNDESGTKHNIIGSIDPDDGPEVRPLSFSIAWRDDDGNSLHSVTAYTGQLNAKEEQPYIEVIFLIADHNTPLWKGTGISYENYERV